MTDRTCDECGSDDVVMPPDANGNVLCRGCAKLAVEDIKRKIEGRDHDE